MLRNLIGIVVGAVIGALIGAVIMLAVSKLLNLTYSPKELGPQVSSGQSVNSTHRLAPLTCGVVISGSKDDLLTSGVRLLRPIDKILSDSLLAAGRKYFREVRMMETMSQSIQRNRSDENE